ncbi:MAG: HlyD family efflux transporter periplasmic adaptor subunit [Vampirovibrionales bacterium]|nr:HlyD family efflux transporter periplasmic adaptor subunit [Vampirovibrionales bacterium]
MTTRYLSEFVPQSLQQVQSSNHYQRFAMLLVMLLITSVLCLVFVPWQQSVTGLGEVTVFSPSERPQTVSAQMDGRIVRWFVNEGDTVKAGDPLVELAEIDNYFLDTDLLARLKGQRQALEAKRLAIGSGMGSTASQVGSLGQYAKVAVPAATQKIEQSRNKLKAAQQALETAQLNHARRQELFAQGLRSKRDFELAELDLAKAQAELGVAQRDVTVAELEQGKTTYEASAKIQESEAKLAKSQETLAELDKDLLKMDIEIANMGHRVSQRMVKAPIGGQVVRILALGEGQTVKESTSLAVVVPKTTDQAVALTIADFNAPLVAVGRPVRIQFSGWPALQFSGWPSISVGTFAGTVAVVDALDDGMNRYRVLVRPDWKRIKAGKDKPWPSPKYLRAGTQAHGWIMLDTVALGFELWRQFNGFPPSLKKAPADTYINSAKGGVTEETSSTKEGNKVYRTKQKV